MRKINLSKMLIASILLLFFSLVGFANIPVQQQSPAANQLVPQGQYQNQSQGTNQNYYNKEEAERRARFQRDEQEQREGRENRLQEQNQNYNNRENQYNRQPVNNYQYNRPQNNQEQNREQEQVPNMNLKVNKDNKGQLKVLDDIKTKHGEAIITELASDNQVTDDGKTEVPKNNGIEVPLNTTPVQTQNYQFSKEKKDKTGIEVGKYITPVTYETYHPKSEPTK